MVENGGLFLIFDNNDGMITIHALMDATIEEARVYLRRVLDIYPGAVLKPRLIID